ncbi:MAG: hypothetical protein ACE366_30000 [Bradymonadia bacterium]
MSITSELQICPSPAPGSKALPVRYGPEGWSMTPVEEAIDPGALPPFPDDILGPAIVRRVQALRPEAQTPSC